MLRDLFKRFCEGVGFAAVTYLIVITIRMQATVPTVRNTASVLIIGGLIGIATLLFHSDISYLAALAGHFLITVALVMVMLWLNHWSFDLATFVMIIVIYVIIWLIMRLNQDHDVKQINQKLRERH